MSKRSYHHGNLREALLEAVAEQVRDSGVESVSLRETARRAGVSHAAPAHQIGNKLGLMTAFAAQGQERLGVELRAALERADGNPLERLMALVSAYARFGVDHREHFAVMSRLDLIDDRVPGLDDAGQANFDLLLSAVTQCQREGWRDDEDPVEVSVLVWASVHGLVELWLRGFVDRPVMARGIERLAKRLIGPG